MKIFVDDIRQPWDVYPEYHAFFGQWATVRDARDFEMRLERCLERGTPPTMISFDNDLGPGQMEGKEILKAVIEDIQNGLYPAPVLLVHSANVPAGNYMRGLIAAFLAHLSDQPDTTPWNAYLELTKSFGIEIQITDWRKVDV